MRIRTLASCDRYNYGDLLFPIVTRLALEAVDAQQFGPERFVNYGLRRSDLAEFGALPSLGIRDLFRDTGSGDCVLVAGGENLAQTWLVMHFTLLEAGHVEQLQRVERSFPDLAGLISRHFLGGRNRFPYILDPGHFSKGTRVLYNSVGGWPLGHYPTKARRSIADSLARSSFLSVRDAKTASIIKSIDPSVNLTLAPDIVFLLPEFFDLERLATFVSPEIQSLIDSAGDYVTVQCNTRFAEAHRDELIRQLRDLSTATGCNIILAPIGRIHSFEDNRALNPLTGLLGPKAALLPDTATIFDIAQTIVSSRLFCGTSLHGAITALAYNVPFVAFQNEDPKVANNIAYWNLAEHFRPAPAAAISGQAQKALAMDPHWIAAQSERLRAHARANVRLLAQNLAG